MNSLFDIDADFALGQVDLQTFLVAGNKRRNLLYSQQDLDDREYFVSTEKSFK